jgi:hypothetical protein
MKIRTVFYLFILLLVSLLLFFTLRPSPTPILPIYSNKPILWRYWEVVSPDVSRPGYIDLCYASHEKHCSQDFQIISLDQKTIYTYLPYLRHEKLHRKLPIQQRVDYYRYHLLRDYGGVWIDADILTLKSLGPIYQKLLQKQKQKQTQNPSYDYYGFGCGLDPPDADKGKDHPTNWLMMSKKGGRFVTRLCQKVQKILEEETPIDFNVEYHALGKDALRATILDIRREDPSWDYLHFPSRGQEFDPEGRKLNDIFQPFDASESPDIPRYFFPLYHSAPGYPDWFKKLKKNDFLKASQAQGIYLYPILQKAFA